MEIDANERLERLDMIESAIFRAHDAGFSDDQILAVVYEAIQTIKEEAD